MNTEKVIKDSLVNFNGKVAVYYDDLKGNVIKINEKEQYNAASNFDDEYPYSQGRKISGMIFNEFIRKNLDKK